MDLRQRLADAEEADHHGDKREPAPEFGHAEGEALLGCQGIEADGADQEPERAGDDALGEAFAREQAEQQDVEQPQQHEVPRLEGQREVRDHRREEGEAKDADNTAQHGYARPGIAPM